MSTIQSIKTPKGNLEWVTIRGEGKENLSGKLQYVANLVLDPSKNEAHQDFIDSIDEFWAANKPQGFKKPAKSLGYYLHTPKLDADGEQAYDEEGNKLMVPVSEGGKVYLAFKTGTTYKDGKTKVVRVFNSKAKEVAITDNIIGNDSVGYISGAMDIYVNKSKQNTITGAGVTLYLNDIQVVKLEEYKAGSSFTADEEDADGWDGDEGWDGESSEQSESTPQAKARPKL